MIELEPAMIYRLDVTGPVEAADGSAANPRRAARASFIARGRLLGAKAIEYDVYRVQ